MEPDGPVNRVERTFWTVWYYISGAVSRFLRPEPTDTVSNDQDSGLQQSAVVGEPVDTHHPEGDSSGRAVDEERPLAIVSVLSSSRPIVAWELCTTDVNLGPEEESIDYNGQLSEGRENKASEEGESMREEQFGQTGNDDAGLLIFKVARATKAEEAENGDQKLCTHGQGEAAEKDEYEEHANRETLNLTDDAMSEDMGGSGRKAGAEEDTRGAMTQDDHQKLDETMREIQEKEKDDKMHHEDEQALEAGNTEITLCPMTGFSSEEEHSRHIGEARLQTDAADTAVMHEEVENSDGVSQLASENKSIRDEGGNQVKNHSSVCEELSGNDRGVKGDPGLDNELKMTSGKSVNVLEGVGQELVMAHGERDEIEDESTLAEMELGGEEYVSEAADNQARDEEPQQEEDDDIKTVTEESQCFTQHVTRHEEVVQNAEAELHTDEITDREKEDVANDTEVQTKPRETDCVQGTANNAKSNVTTTDISVEERFYDKDKVEEGRFSSDEEGNKESCMETACTATSVTVTPQGETGQEVSRHIPPGVFEGQVVVSQELNFTSCEETQEGVPEYNNEPGPEENTKQRFLEEGNRREINATQLPEEVESKGSGSLQNSGTGGGFLLVRGHMEEEQERTEDIKKDHTRLLQLTDTGVPQETEKPVVEPVIAGSGHLFEEGEETFLNSSMKTATGHLEKEFETDDKTTKELQDGTEELLVNFQKGEGSSGTRDAAGDGRETMRAAAADDSLVGFSGETLKVLEAEVQKMTELGFFQDAFNSEQSFTKSGFMKQLDETEPKLLEDSSAQMQDAGIDMEETGYGVGEEAVEDEMQNKNEMDTLNVEVAGPAAMLTTENNKNMLFAKCELSRPDESLETRGQLSDEALEVSREEMLTDTETADELMTTECETKDVTLIPTEEMAKHVTESEGSRAGKTRSSVGECQDVIDEEILDLWLETALLKDAGGMEQQEGPEPGQEMDQKTDPSKEGPEEVPSLQTEEEMSVSEESGLVSDTEMSPSTAESGLLDLSVSEWGKGHIDTHLLESTSTGSSQGIYDMSVCWSESADVSKFYTQLPDSQDILLEETAERGRSDPAEEELTAEMGSSAAGQLNLESNQSGDEASEERIESAETETGPQKETDAGVASRTERKDTGEADAGTLTKMRALFNDEIINVADVLLGLNVFDSPDATGSGSEALLTESQGDTHLLDKRQATTRWEDIAESLPEPNRTEVAGQQTTHSEVQTEVDASALDFTAQKSRIAVKNPCVRPPKDPRSLIHMPSVDPTPSPRLPVKVPTGVPLGGVGIGIKLPGLGAGFPVLKKTHVVTEEKSPETLLQEPETKPEEKRDTPKQDEAQHKPKWMPPRHPGFGNPLMSELKTKLKKTTKE